MSRSIALILIAGGMVGACSGTESTRSRPEDVAPPADVATVESSTPREEPAPSPDAVSRVVQEALRTDGDLSYDTLIRRLGVPRAVQTEPVDNQYVQGQIDTLRTLVYPGLEALVYDVTDDPRAFLVRLSLSGAQYTAPAGIRVGASEARVRGELGPPTRRNASEGEWIYQEPKPAPTSMVVQFRDGRVVQIEWEFPFT